MRSLLDGRTDLIEEMDEDINSKRYYGFALGVILVMISKQYSALGDDKNALIYMQSAKLVYIPKLFICPLSIVILERLRLRSKIVKAKYCRKCRQ